MIADKIAIEAALGNVTELAWTMFSQVIGPHSGLAMLDGREVPATIKDGSKIFSETHYPRKDLTSNYLEVSIFNILRQPSRSATSEDGSGDGSTSATIYTVCLLAKIKQNGNTYYNGFDKLFEIPLSERPADTLRVPVAERHNVMQDLINVYLHDRVEEGVVKVDFEKPAEACEILEKTGHTSCGDYEVSEILASAYMAGGTNTKITIKPAMGETDSSEKPLLRFVSNELRLGTKQLENDTKNHAYSFDGNAKILLLKGVLTENTKHFIHTVEDTMSAVDGSGTILVVCYSVDVAMIKYLEDRMDEPATPTTPIVVVTCDPTRDTRYDILNSLGIYTGATPIDEQDLLDDDKMDEITEAGFETFAGDVDSMTMCYSRGIISNKSTENGNNRHYNDELVKLEQLIVDGTNGNETLNHTTGKYKAKLSMLKGSDVIIYLGGKSPSVKSMRIYLAEDAMLAMRSVIDHGCIAPYMSMYTVASEKQYFEKNDSIIAGFHKLNKYTRKSIYRLAQGCVQKGMYGSFAVPDGRTVDNFISGIEGYDTILDGVMKFIPEDMSMDTRDFTKSNLTRAALYITHTLCRKMMDTVHDTLIDFTRVVVPDVELLSDRAYHQRRKITDAISGIEYDMFDVQGKFNIMNVPVVDTFQTQRNVIDASISIITSILCCRLFISPGEINITNLDGKEVIL